MGRRPRPQGPSPAEGLNLARFRGDPTALRMMPGDMVQTAFCLLNKAQAPTPMDKLYFDMFCDKAEKEGMPDYVYDSMINGLVTGDPMAPPDPGMMRGVLCPDANNCIVPLTLKGIWGYGCWCNFDVQLLEGSSQPLNQYDAICKAMQQCLRCAVFDGEEQGEVCNPKDPNMEYNSTYKFNLGSQSMEADCGQQNDGDCEIRVCTCELKLISGVLEALWDGADYNIDLLHIRGFDPNEECTATVDPTQGDAATEPGCCGIYPERETYNKVLRSCCTSATSQTIFNENTHVCCETDGTVHETGAATAPC